MIITTTTIIFLWLALNNYQPPFKERKKWLVTDTSEIKSQWINSNIINVKNLDYIIFVPDFISNDFPTYQESILTFRKEKRFFSQKVKAYIDKDILIIFDIW